VPDRLPARAPSNTERLSVVRALAEARTRGEIRQDDQLERTDMAVRVTSLVELATLVEDLSEQPPLPEPGPAPSRRGVLLGAVGLVAAGVAGAAVLTGRDDETPVPEAVASASAPLARTPSPTSTPTPTPPAPAPAPAPDVDLYTVAGLHVLFAEYRSTLGTWQAYDVSVTDRQQASADAVVLPVAKRRLQWWSWSPDERWTTVFDPQSVASDTRQVIDLRRVDLAAVVATIAKARRSSNVEEPDQLGISFHHDPEHGGVVEFHVSNPYSEVGTMTTDLSGRVLERRPFARS
jgi:hypothetical protein